MQIFLSAEYFMACTNIHLQQENLALKKFADHIRTTRACQGHFQSVPHYFTGTIAKQCYSLSLELHGILTRFTQNILATMSKMK